MMRRTIPFIVALAPFLWAARLAAAPVGLPSGAKPVVVTFSVCASSQKPSGVNLPGSAILLHAKVAMKGAPHPWMW